MEIINKLYDDRINALNVLFEISIEEYYNISQKIIDSNEFQRRRVKSSSTVYSLLKSDLLQGCVIPPIVLALSKVETKAVQDLSDKDILEIIDQNQERVLILDGLQRTYTIRDLISDLKSQDDIDNLNRVYRHKLRIEVYFGINKIGILYRMLSLNTGQTPMSIRHQIEILYSDYLLEDLEDVKLVTESNDEQSTGIGRYKFKDIIEGFNSYLGRDYLTIDRFDILDNIKSLEKLSKEAQETDLFKNFLYSYHSIFKFILENSDNWEFGADRVEKNLTGQPFGKNVEKIFIKSQVMTGFGSAIGKLVDFQQISNFEEIKQLIPKIDNQNIPDDLDNLILKLDNVRLNSKKIGNDQRMFFHFLFRELFDKKGDSYLNLGSAINEAFKSYERKTQ